MSIEEELIQLRAENAAQREQIVMLQGQLDDALAQLKAALARIAEFEQHRPPDPPAFVKPNAPTPEPKPRRKRDPKHNRGLTTVQNI